MKTIPPPCPEPEVGPKYWRSLDQLADTPEFRQWMEREFPSGASEFTDPVSRRHFVKIMSASFLLAGLGLTGCRKPEEHILPFSKLPEGYVHGLAQFYATSRPTRGSAVPLLVRSNDGRPTKVEGNPNHPASNGGTDRFTQASILNLYDPDRAMRFAKNGSATTRDSALEALAQLSIQAQANGGEGLAFLLERSSSPSRERLQKIITEKFPKARWHIYEPVDFDIHRQAASIACGKSVTPEFRLDQAKRIVSLDCDFIGAEEDAYRYIRDFTKGRKIEGPEDDMNRLYVLEGLFTLTGGNADHRMRLAPSQVLPAAARLAVEILEGDAAPALNKLGEEFKGDREWLAECAKDLLDHEGQSLVIAGHSQPLAVHLIAHAINHHLASEGKTLAFLPVNESKDGSITELAQTLNAGEIETLVVLGGNPAYTAPADIDWTKSQSKAKTIIRWAYYEDESFAGSTWNLPAAHYLESWGDARTGAGIHVSIQPLIEPLFGGLTEIEVLARIASLNTTRPYDIVRDTFKQIAPSENFEETWKRFLHDGFWTGKPEQSNITIDPAATAQALSDASVLPVPTPQQLEVIFHRDYKVDDGRYNNNGWLQELPDPVTKMCWENVILVSPNTAKALNLDLVNHENNDLQVPVVRIQVNGKSVEGPAWVQPGQADNIIAVSLGYGRRKTGRIGSDIPGYDAYQIRTAAAPYIAQNAKLSNTGKKHRLATTQDHGVMEGRPVIREANLEQFKKHPEFPKAMNLPEPPNAQPLYPNPLDARMKNALHQWGMVIDLNSCVGCNACAVACQSENNVPIVGKDQVMRGREMHWLRVDRYFAGDPSDAEMVTQPMLCQHCEAAPCENVCPVNATAHDDEGLNLMVYNRCVGTRYCSNNCPYKVRRFNFFDYNKRTLNELKGPVGVTGPFYPNPITGKVAGEWGIKQWIEDPQQGYRTGEEWDLYKMVKNPDVTVRMRGVMEKCTFCVQRIEQAKIAQKIKAGPSGDVRLKESEGTIPKTACQQACPAGAIVFGDISDPQSTVSKQKSQGRNYSVLEFLSTKPRLTYLAKVRNPNDKMPDYQKVLKEKEVPMPESTKEWARKEHKEGDPFEAHGGGHSTGHKSEGEHPKGAH